MMETDRLLTFEEAARLLGLKIATLRAWRLAGRIPIVRVGSRAVRVPLSVVRQITSDGFVPPRRKTG
jgi:excisionase family DNA binding protein